MKNFKDLSNSCFSSVKKFNFAFVLDDFDNGISLKIVQSVYCLK